MKRDTYGVEMDEAAISAFLDRQGDGVLAFGGDLAYALPMSFGFDPLGNRLIFQFVFDPESRKREYVDAGEEVTLVTYEWVAPDDWRSVVVTGSLGRIDPDSRAAVDASEVFAPRATAVSLTVFEKPAAELDPEWYELEITEMHGRQHPSL